MPGVCLFVCLSANLRKTTTERIFVKILSGNVILQKEELMNFATHPLPNTGIFERFFNIARRRVLPQFIIGLHHRSE